MLFWLAASYATGMAVALRNFHCIEVVERVAKHFPVENKGGCWSSTVPLLHCHGNTTPKTSWRHSVVIACLCRSCSIATAALCCALLQSANDVFTRDGGCVVCVFVFIVCDRGVLFFFASHHRKSVSLLSCVLKADLPTTVVSE